MNKITFFKSLTGLILFFGSAAQACWAPPPEIVWATSANGEYAFKRENNTGTITVYKAGDREKALWSQVLPEFSGLFSTVILADSGELLLHVRGNHEVHRLEDTAVRVVKSDGSSVALPAKDFIDKLGSPQEPRMSTSPSRLWLGRFGEGVIDQGFSLTNADGIEKTVRFKDLKFIPVKP